MALEVLSLALLALAVSLDSLTVGVLYGARGIRLPWGAMAIVSLATGLLLSLSMAAGGALGALLPAALAARAGALLLVAVGCWVTYQTWRNHSRQPVPLTPQEVQRRVWRVRLGTVGIVVEILREPGAADLDRSGHINPLEACLLGIALALDSVAAGLGAAMAGYSRLGLPVAATGLSYLFLLLGSRGAGLLPWRISGRWAMLHGLVLLLLGVYRMIA